MIQNNLDICINHTLYDIHLAKDELFAIIVNDFFQYSLLLFLRRELSNDLDNVLDMDLNEALIYEIEN